MAERPTRIVVVYYSSSGTLRQLAEGLAEGAALAGAEVRVRRVADFDEDPAVSHPEPVPSLDDLDWADGVALGTPSRFGNVAAEMKRFIDSTHPLWATGGLVNKVVTGFTAAGSRHGGQETTLLALYQSVYHWGGLILSAGYVHPVQRAAGGNPYGLSALASRSGEVEAATLGAAHVLGGRLAAVATSLRFSAVPV